LPQYSESAFPFRRICRLAYRWVTLGSSKNLTALNICNAKELTRTSNPTQSIRQIFGDAEDLADFFWSLSKK